MRAARLLLGAVPILTLAAVLVVYLLIDRRLTALEQMARKTLCEAQYARVLAAAGDKQVFEAEGPAGEIAVFTEGSKKWKTLSACTGER